MIILVTVGTSLPHDKLIETMDNLVGEGLVNIPVIAQIGFGKYIPKNIRYFRFFNDLEQFYNMDPIVISNCGAETILENVTKGRKLIVVQNPGIIGGHEWEFIEKLEKDGNLIWCRKLDEILVCIRKALTTKFNKLDVYKFDFMSVLKELMRNGKD